MAWTPSLIGAFASAIILGAFSIVVGILARFRGPAKWYAIFGASFAATNACFNLAEAILDAYGSVLAVNGRDLIVYRILIVAGTSFIIPWIIGVIKLLHCYNGGRDNLLGWTVAGTVGALTTVAGMFSWADSQLDVVWALRFRIMNTLFYMAVAWMAVAPWLMARARLREPMSGQAILGIALAAYPLMRTGELLFANSLVAREFSAVTVTWLLMQFFIVSVAFGGLVAGWLKVGAREQNRVGLKMVAAGSLFLLGGFMAGLYWEEFPASGVARAFDVLLVAYAILRLQYLGLDVKVRWGLSKSSVAAVFVAVFFIASEAASQFFGDRFNNNYIGIGAAGLLVLGIAPLQRMADRFASSTIPVTTPMGTRLAASDLYRQQVKQAWMDGHIAPEERRMLRRLRVDLGMTPDEADRIEDDVEIGLSKHVN